MAKVKTVEFGVREVNFPHVMIITLPEGRNDPVVLSEDFGIEARLDHPEDNNYLRAKIDRKVWRRVQEGVKTYLNRRLKEHGMKAGRFATGANRIERLLGREVAVLCYALEAATPDEADVIFKSWSNYRPEELWWIFSRVEQDGGALGNIRRGWRLALPTILGTGGEVKTSPIPAQDILPV